MSKHQFQFKQFAIEQDQCAMKVSLDACLLGAMVQVANCQRILDIGTGTGLLSLMAAQRCPAQIDAIEIDDRACQQAQVNIHNSPFAKRITLHQGAIQDFKPEQKYDAIICNPPFFSKQLKNPDPQRNLARHNDSLSFHQLCECIVFCLTPTGQATLLLPVSEFDNFMQYATAQKLQLRAATLIRARADKAANRVIFAISKHTGSEQTAIHSDLCIYEDASNHYTATFKKWLQPYYLKL